jgi:hypothetical protein
MGGHDDHYEGALRRHSRVTEERAEAPSPPLSAARSTSV